MADRITNTVYKLRHDLHVTQEDLAQAVAVTRQTIIAIEKGNYTPSVLLALKIARYFKKPVDQIFRLSHN